MSSLIVEVCRVEAVDRHPNADRMSICVVKGWRVCAGLDTFRPGDPCIYIPPDSILPPDLAERLGCARYLVPLPVNADGVRPPGGRVKVARLRGEPSYGLIAGLDDPSLEVGTDVSARLGITKWEPPPVVGDSEGERAPTAFHHYTDIENYRNFPDLIAEGEEVVFTEKLHGMNCRLGLVRQADDGGRGEVGFACAEAGGEWELMAGSHNQRRKPTDRKGRPCRFWSVFSEPARELLRHLQPRATQSVVLFGELFGSGVQDIWYGLENGQFALRAFDLAVDGTYLDFDEKQALFRRFGIEPVPVLYRGPFSRAAVEAHVDGPTTMCAKEKAGKFPGREGIVVTPARERSAAVGRRCFERVVLKAISFAYLERKGGTEYH